MGREIKRVPLDFKWRMHFPWKGYVNPYSSRKCPECDGSGHNKETHQIEEDWYSFEDPDRRWCNNITQDEVDALVKAGRLMDFTHTFVEGKGWQPIKPKPVVTAVTINEWSKRGMGHDAINRWICVETRAKRLGVWGNCWLCDGEGEIWYSKRIKKLSENFKNHEPPRGEGWQVWETVSEGSPISPVFATPEECINWLVEVEKVSRPAAEKFVLKDKWSMSAASVNGKFYAGIESVLASEENSTKGATA